MSEQGEPDEEVPIGEFPPGLDGLSGEIERLASQSQDRQALRGEIADLSDQLAPLLEAARRTLAGVDGNPDALGAYLRKALGAVKVEAAATMSASATLSAGGAVHGAGAVLMAKATITAVGTVTAGPASVVVAAPPGSVVVTPETTASRTLLDRLTAARIFYIVLIWLLVAGVGVVIQDFKLPPDVSAQMQTDPNYVAIALDLTVLLLATRKRK